MENNNEHNSEQTTQQKKLRVEFESGQEAALEMEFRDDLDKLRFIYQYVLNFSQLKVDTVIIHKHHKDIRLKNEISSFFREYNIIEWKAPDDDLDVYAYLKTLGYACLFCSIVLQGERVTRERVEDESQDAERTRQNGSGAEHDSQGAERSAGDGENVFDDIRRIPQKDVTITLARDGYPRVLFEILLIKAMIGSRQHLVSSM